MQAPKEAMSGSVTLHKRPTTPGRVSRQTVRDVDYANYSRKEKDGHKERESKRSSLSFLRRSKSGDRSIKPIVPNIPQQPPRIPELWAANGSPPQSEDTNVSDSVDVASTTLGIPSMPLGRRSTDTGISGVSSGPGGYYVPMKSSGKDSIPETTASGGSMAHRGRYSYAPSAVSTVNPPRRVRRRKDPTPFNILIIGARNSGKTSFIQFLRQAFTLKLKKGEQVEDQQHQERNPKPPFVRTYLETEIDGERIGLTLWDSQGLERNIVDLQLREITAFIESKFEETFTEETKVIRAPGVRDTHIHCAFHLLDPAHLESSILHASSNSNANGNGIISGGLDEDLDLQVLRGLKGKTTVIPVISKADTITTAHMNVLKNIVRASLRRAGLDPLEALDLDLEAYGITPTVVSGIMAGPLPVRIGAGSRIDEEEEDEVVELDHENKGRRIDGFIIGSRAGEDADSEEGSTEAELKTHKRTVSRASHASNSTSSTNAMSNIDFIPLSVISPDSYEPGAIGRRFPWGFADPYNAEHCDFVRLKDSVFSEWRGDLREASREIWYENWRTSRLSGEKGGRKANGGFRRR